MRVDPNSIIKTLKEQNFHAQRTASLFGIHRATVYRWLKRAQTLSPGYVRHTKLVRAKPGRKHAVYKLTSEEQSGIIAVRQETGYAAVKIKGELQLPVGVNTIHRLLARKRLLHTYGNHIRSRYQKTVHMHLKNTTTIGKLQMDVKYLTPELTGLPYTCFEYGIVDIYS